MDYFSGLDELKKIMTRLCIKGEWSQISDSHHLFRHNNGAVLNWYQKGKIEIQGKHHLTDKFSRLLDELKTRQTQDHVINGSKEIFKHKHPQNIKTTVMNYSEIIIGLVGAVGTNLDEISRIISERLNAFEYTSQTIRISKDVISEIKHLDLDERDNFNRINTLMTEGDNLREKSKNNGILALAASAKINQTRETDLSSSLRKPKERNAFIISSLKHPEEVQHLRRIYGNGFFLIGVYADEKRRYEYLIKNKRIEDNNVKKLMDRDSDELFSYGQHTRDTYHLSDFYINVDGDTDKIQNDIWRIIDLIFGKPFITPTFDEFAMFMAFSSSLRSADLSRQVGAVLTKNKTIISSGANDIPKFGGGLYSPEYDPKNKEIIDSENGRDYKRGFDSNAREKKAIIDDILSKIDDDNTKSQIEHILQSSKIKDITEYGRVVHAEMEAILACARSNISTENAELYCTTFPCHNCAKHIIDAGIKRVIYIEPYPKSKAFTFHDDAITLQKEDKEKVLFETFVGVGPRSFFNLFSTNLGDGYPIIRKQKNGDIIAWTEKNAKPRMFMSPISYIERETLAAATVKESLGELL